MRLALLDPVAAHDARGELRKPELLEQRHRQGVRLVRDDAPRPYIENIFNYRVYIYEYMRISIEISLVYLEKARAQRFTPLDGERRPEAQANEAQGAVRGLVARDRVSHRCFVVLGEQTIQDGDEVGRRVDERAVEVEQDAGDRQDLGRLTVYAK